MREETIERNENSFKSNIKMKILKKFVFFDKNIASFVFLVR